MLDLRDNDFLISILIYMHDHFQLLGNMDIDTKQQG